MAGDSDERKESGEKWEEEEQEYTEQAPLALNIEPGKVGASAEPAKSKAGLEAEPPPKGAVLFGVILYAACSSTLLLINAVAVRRVKDASFVLCIQFVFSALACRVIRVAKPDADVELIHWNKARPFLPACAVFFMCLLSNTEALKYVNPETVIVARCGSPVAVALLEHATLGRALPNVQGIVCLLAIVGGAVVYVLSDAGFRVKGYTWLIIYYVFIVTEMVFLKYIVENLPMSTWTRVYYNNLLSIPLVLIAAMLMGFGKFLHADWDFWTVLLMLLACVVGVAISYAGFNLRKLVSATTFTIVGVVCKMITILINDVMWDNHSNFLGHVGLLTCIAGGFLYERSKKKG